MYHKLIENISFHMHLLDIDSELLKQSREKPCSYCGGILHVADYPRSPLGLPASIRKYYSTRFGLCCGTCRKRTPIQTVRFFGCKRFITAIIILASLLNQRITDRTINRVHRHLGFNLSKRTWKRWRRWWHEVFLETSFWKSKGLLPAQTLHATYPRHLLSQYQANCFKEKFLKLLGWLAPLTAGAYRAV